MKRLSRYFTHYRVHTETGELRPWFGIGPVKESATGLVDAASLRTIGFSVSFGPHAFAIHRGS